MKGFARKVVLIVLACMVLGGCENNTTQEATTEKETVWTITQFNALYDEVQSFYTIMDESGGIIVIDGGNTDNEEIVRRVLEGYGGQVKIWILTRPDTQHIGAFMKIYEDPQNISIAQVYDAFIDWQRYDDYGNRAARNMYEEYLKLTKDDAKIVHVNRDAKFYGCGLEFECFNAYDSYVEEYTQDLSQDGSLMLKISGKKQTFLFCSDVSYDMEQFLIDEYADKLNADYVQMSNHGNDGLSLEFYKLVSPSVAFFDGKSSIYDQSNVPEGRSYDDYKAYFEENGVTMYDLSTAPNIVEFR